MPRHPQPVHGQHRLTPARQPRQRLARASQGEKRRVGEAEGRAVVALLGDESEHVAERHVLAAEDVPLAHGAALQRRDDPARAVVGVDEVEAGVHVGRHAAARRLQDDAARGRRAAVARADGRGGVRDGRRQPLLAHQALDEALGLGLAALVGADGLLRPRRVGLRRGRAVGARLQRGDGGDVDDPRVAGPPGGAHHRLGAGNVDREHARRIGDEDAVVRRAVHQRVAARGGRAKARGVGEVAGRELDADAVQHLRRRAGAAQRAHLVPGEDERPRHGRTQETGAPGEHHPHGAWMPGFASARQWGGAPFHATGGA